MSKTPRPGYAAGNILNMLVHLGADLTGYDFSCLSKSTSSAVEEA
jgi:hypothetical protein